MPTAYNAPPDPDPIGELLLTVETPEDLEVLRKWHEEAEAAREGAKILTHAEASSAKGGEIVRLVGGVVVGGDEWGAMLDGNQEKPDGGTYKNGRRA